MIPYGGRSAASALASTGDFARMKPSDPGQSLRALVMSHLSVSKEEPFAKEMVLSDAVLREAYAAHTTGEKQGTGVKGE